MNNYPRFRDFAREEHPLEGKKKRLDNILNIEILIHDFKISKSKIREGNYATIQFSLNGNNEKYVVFTGSQVIIDQLEKYKDKLPFYATIVKKYNYYSLS